MRRFTQVTTLLLCLFLTGCSSSSPSTGDSVKIVTLDTKSVPKNLTIYLNDEPLPTQTNNGDLKLSVPSDQDSLITIKNEKPAITYQVKIPQESKDSVSLKIDPNVNEELNQQVANFFKDYFAAVNHKKNALSFLSEDSIFDSKDVYNHSFKSAVIFTASSKPLMIQDKPELIVLVEAQNRETPSTTRTYQFRLLWENGKWKVFHQKILYEVFEGKLLFESEKNSYPGEQAPGPYDVVLSF